MIAGPNPYLNIGMTSRPKRSMEVMTLSWGIMSVCMTMST